MIKKLTAKVQKLDAKLEPDLKEFSKCLIIEPDTKELALKKGTVYSVFNIKGSAGFDVELITKVLKDILHDSYYQSENISPIQSLEKAILEAKNKISGLSNETVVNEEQTTEFNIVSAVLWGNVLYIVEFGQMESYIMKEGNVEAVNTMTEGNFSAASGVVNEEDVVILCTKQFGEEYPPDRLLEANILEESLTSQQACLLMRLLVDTSFSEDEKIDFGLEPPSENKAKETVEKMAKSFKEGSTKTKSMFSKLVKKIIKNKKEKKPLDKEPEIPNKTTKLQLKRRIKPVKKINAKFILIPVAVIALVGIIFSVIKLTKNEELPQEEAVTQEPSLSPEPIKEPDTSKDEEYNIQRIEPEAFYDIKIAETNADPSEILCLEENIIVTDRNNNKLYISDRGSPSFTGLETMFTGIRSPINSDGNLGFLDNTNYKVFDLETSSVAQEYSIENIEKTSLIRPYSGFLYTVANSQILKYTVSDEALEPVVWGTNEEFENAKDMDIAYSIYIVTSDGKLSEFTSGEKTTFEVADYPYENLKVKNIETDLDFENIYISDADKRNIIVIDDTGAYIKQYQTNELDTWNNIKDFSVCPAEDQVFILNNSKIYKLNL